MALIHSRKEKVHTLGQGIGGQSRDGIWLLDDDVSMLKALGRLMNSAGFIVEKFNDPATFLAKLQRPGILSCASSKIHGCVSRRVSGTQMRHDNVPTFGII